MKKIIKSLLFFILPVASFCSEGDSIRPDKFQLGLLYSPELSYRTLKTDTEHTWLKEKQDATDILNFGYSAGVYFGCKFSTRLSLEIQTLYSDKGYKTKEYIVENEIAYDYREKVPYKSCLTYHFHYLDIPFKLNYTIINRKLKFYSTAGVSFNIFLNEEKKTDLLYKDGNSDSFHSISTNDAQEINIAILGGLGICYNLTERYSFKVEPVIKHSMNAIFNAPVKDYLYSVGINTGIAYSF